MRACPVVLGRTTDRATTPDAVVRESSGLDLGWIVDDCGHRRSASSASVLSASFAKSGLRNCLPLGDHDQCVSPLRGLPRALFAEHQIVALAEDPRRLHASPPGSNARTRRAGVPELFASRRAARRLAHVVGVRLERQPPHREGLAAQRGLATVMADDAARTACPFCAMIDRFDRRRAPSASIAVLVRGALECLHVLREAGTAVTGARIDEVNSRCAGRSRCPGGPSRRPRRRVRRCSRSRS